MKKLLFIIGIVLFIFVLVSTSSFSLVNAEDDLVPEPVDDTELVLDEPAIEDTVVVYDPILKHGMMNAIQFFMILGIF